MKQWSKGSVMPMCASERPSKCGLGTGAEGGTLFEESLQSGRIMYTLGWHQKRLGSPGGIVITLRLAVTCCFADLRRFSPSPRVEEQSSMKQASLLVHNASCLAAYALLRPAT